MKFQQRAHLWPEAGETKVISTAILCRTLYHKADSQAHSRIVQERTVSLCSDDFRDIEELLQVLASFGEGVH